MSIHFHSRQRGIALIMVLLIIVVLAGLASIFAMRMKVETTLARNANHDVELEWIGRSGVEAMKWLLAQASQGQDGQVDFRNSIWAGGSGMDSNNMAAQFPNPYELGDGRSFGWKIEDLDRKFNINSTDPEVLRHGLTMVGVDPGAHSTIIDSILDWRDIDDDPHPSGVESDHYQSLESPHFAKNGPIDDISELLRINGVTPAMFWGSSAQGVMSRLPPAMQSHFDEPIYAVGLKDVFTALSGRAININTADATQLQVVPGIDENIAQAIISRRAGPDGVDGSSDDTPFRNANELSSIAGIPPPVFQRIAGYLSTRSFVFEARIEARVDNQTRNFVAVLRRNSPRDVQLLSFYWH